MVGPMPCPRCNSPRVRTDLIDLNATPIVTLGSCIDCNLKLDDRAWVLWFHVNEIQRERACQES